MIDRRFFAEGAAIVGAAVLCAAVANFVADRERKLAWAGVYPNALTVPKKAEPAPPESSGSPAAAAAVTPEAASAPPLAPVSASLPAATPLQPSKGTRDAVSAAPAAVAAVATPPAAKKKFPPHPDQPWVEIGGDDVVALYRDKALFLDARRTSVFAEGHIPGARSFAVWEADIEDKVKALLDEGLDPSIPIVIYCTGGHCEDSHMLGDKLYKIGFNNALVYKDGFPDWEKRGLATDKGVPK